MNISKENSLDNVIFRRFNLQVEKRKTVGN